MRATLLLRRCAGLALRTSPWRAAAARCLSSTAAEERCSSCYLPTSWKPLPLVGKREYNHDSTVYSFGLPEGQSLDLPVCACILLHVPAADGRDEAVRPYTPVSDNGALGSFELLVKRYEGGAASQYLHSLPLGSEVSFKHIPFNIKTQYPFEGKESVTMLCGGSGITPMYQALWKLLGSKDDTRPITLIYGSRSVDDILMKDELDAWAKAHPRLKVVHVVGESADASSPSGWADAPTYIAESGWVDEAKIAKYAFPPSDDTLVFVCGLPAMYEALCGPRTEASLSEGSVLQRLGYTAEMVAKM